LSLVDEHLAAAYARFQRQAARNVPMERDARIEAPSVRRKPQLGLMYGLAPNRP